MKTKSTDTTGTLFVVSTSHMDWDWNATFEQYYSNGLKRAHLMTIWVWRIF